ncbi:unnamed protein product [Clavelina lepadiformis]|uniref:Transporter n=1 Tax=Clavelina lepadiformis TaxID=159417 RepID=A0ABP0F0R4_CLALP
MTKTKMDTDELAIEEGYAKKIGKSQDSDEDRGNWTNKAEFLLSMIGYAVGLGNVWRFPYLAFQNGGGAFLIPYLIMLCVAGLPIFFLEVSLGQFCSQGPLGAFRGVPIVKGLGFAMVVISVYVGIYYNVVITYTLFYLFSSFTADVPWRGCGNPWNTNECVDSHLTANVTCLTNITANSTGLFLENNLTDFASTILPNVSSAAGFNQSLVNTTCLDRVSPSENYWKNRVLGLTDGIHNLGSVRLELVLILMLAWAIIYLCLLKGVKSSGKAVYFTATFPYVVLTILLVRGLTLDGAFDGVVYFFKPRWELLKESKVWKDAATQIFYSLSASWGGLITLSSYNKFNNNCYRDSLIVVLTNSFTSIYAGVAVFSVIGFMANVLKTDISKVVADGPGLAFVVYPEALSQMPISPLWAVLFFLMLFTLGLDTMFATLETIVTSFTDVFPTTLRRHKALFTLAVCVVLFLLGIPLVTQGGFYYLHLMDSYAASYTLILCAIVEMLAISYIYGLDRFCDDIKLMTGKAPGLYWRITWSFVSPAVLLFIFIYSLANYKPLKLNDYAFPPWANAIGWLTVASSALLIPAVAIFQVASRDGSFFERLKSACKPERKWRPYLKQDRTGRYAPKTDIFFPPVDNRSDSPICDSKARLFYSPDSSMSSMTSAT